MAKSIDVVPLQDLKLRGTRPGIKGTILFDENTPTQFLRSGIFTLESEGKLNTHFHDCEEIQHVIQGYGVLRDSEGKDHPLSPGTTFYCHAGPKGAHEIKNTSDFTFICLYVYYSPQGKEVKKYP